MASECECLDCGLRLPGDKGWCSECFKEALNDRAHLAWRSGIAVAFGIMGMVEAIRAKRHLEACPKCGKAEGSRVQKLGDTTWCCMPCARRTDTTPLLIGTLK